MAISTEAYARSCVQLTTVRTNAAFTQWNATVKPMDESNAALNSVVAKVRSATSPAGG